MRLQAVASFRSYHLLKIFINACVFQFAVLRIFKSIGDEVQLIFFLLQIIQQLNGKRK